MAKLIIGCGYLGSRVAQLFRSDKEDTEQTIYAMTRDHDHAEQFKEQGLAPIIADVTDPASLKSLSAANIAVDTLVVAVGYDRNAGLSIHDTYVRGLEHVLAAISPDTGRVVYVSSTGVYGQDDGSLIDEDSPCHPVREGGKACLAAEERLRSHPLGQNSVVLRLAGIYGPGRIPRSAQSSSNEPLPVDPETYLNLIHVDDAAAAVLSAARLPHSPTSRLYCVSDGQPLTRGDYFDELARQQGTPPPKYAAPGESMKDRSAGDKRISNAKMLSDLDITLKYPTWAQGLTASMAAS